MKKLILLLICSCCYSLAFAQKQAVTNEGEVVVLYADGSWEYENAEETETLEIPVNESRTFSSPKESTFLLKSSNFKVGFWINPQKWSFSKSTDGTQAEYELQLKGGDLYGLIITEQISIPMETLRNMALENGRAAAPDIKVIHEEYRMVNGVWVLLMQMNGTVQGIPFSYYGYYYSNENGTVQFITYTAQNLLNTYKESCEELLNGLVEIDS
jgi:hypothetical protein